MALGAVQQEGQPLRWGAFVIIHESQPVATCQVNAAVACQGDVLLWLQCIDQVVGRTTVLARSYYSSGTFGRVVVDYHHFIGQTLL
jgi:hypothetical protein